MTKYDYLGYYYDYGLTLCLTYAVICVEGCTSLTLRRGRKHPLNSWCHITSNMQYYIEYTCQQEGQQIMGSMLYQRYSKDRPTVHAC